jgi:hypothetical protein
MKKFRFALVLMGIMILVMGVYFPAVQAAAVAQRTIDCTVILDDPGLFDRKFFDNDRFYFIDSLDIDLYVGKTKIDTYRFTKDSESLSHQFKVSTDKQGDVYFRISNFGDAPVKQGKTLYIKTERTAFSEVSWIVVNYEKDQANAPKK